MESARLNQALLRIVGIGWVAFAIAAIAVRTVFAAPDVTLLVDRSYCDPAAWATVAEEYAALYQQDQRGQIVIQSVILVSDLGKEVLETPPAPDNFRQLRTYGQPSRDRLAALETTYPNARLLQCGT